MPQYIVFLRGVNTLSGEATQSNCFCLPSEKGSALNGKNLLPMGANSFPLEQIPFQKGPSIQESIPEVTKVVSLVKWLSIYQVYQVP